MNTYLKSCVSKALQTHTSSARRQKPFARWAMAGFISLGNILPMVSQADYVNLSTWQQKGALGNGNWVTSADHKFVYQTINGEPTFYVSSNAFINGTVKGQFGVYGNGDDDYIGFVFGYQGDKFLLFDWSNGYDGAPPGYNLLQVNDVSNFDDDCFWAHQNNPLSCSVLATDYGKGKGWRHGSKYWFELDYRTDRIIIKVGNSPSTLTTIFDITGHFEPGRFGFYNYSQAQVFYGEFTSEGGIPSTNNDDYHLQGKNRLKVPVTKGVLANDSSSTLNGLTVELGNTTNYGNLSLNSNGSFTYVPDNLHCTDNFSYRVFDGKEYSEYTTVNLTMDTVSDLAVSQLQSHEENTRWTVRVDNIGIAPSPESFVNFYTVAPEKGGTLIGSVNLDSLQPGEFQEVALNNVTPLTDTDNLYVVVDAQRQLKECNKINNFIALNPVGILSTPALCQLYAVHDEGANNSQFFTISIKENMEQTEVKTFGTMYEGYDIEALAIAPEANIIYATSGNNTTLGMPKGHLYYVDTQTNMLIPIGSTGFQEIDSLTFSRDGTLWAWAKRDGLVTIDTKTGIGTLQLPSKVLLEDFTLGKQTNPIFYGATQTNLWIYDKSADTLDVACRNLPGEVESLELLSSNLLLLGVHGKQGLHFFDIKACELIESAQIPTATLDDSEGLVVPLEKCSIWNNLLKGIQKELPPKIPGELLSDLPTDQLSNLLCKVLRQIITEYVNEMPNEKLRTFLNDLPPELPSDYPDKFIQDYLEELPVELQNQLLTEWRKEYLQERVTVHLTNVLHNLQNELFPLLPTALVRKPIGKLISDEVDELIDDLVGKIPNYLVSEFISHMPSYLLNRFMENYGEE